MKTTPSLKGNYVHYLVKSSAIRITVAFSALLLAVITDEAGKQDAWVGHLDLEYRHHELECRNSKLGSQTKTIGREICGGSMSYPQLSQKRVDQSILPLLICGGQDY